LILVKLDYYCRRKLNFYRKLLDKYYQIFPKFSPLFVYSIITVSYLLISAMIQARANYEHLIEGELDKYSVQLSSAININSKEISKLKDMQIIANLSKHLWLYQHKNKRIFMIPHESILMVSPKMLVVENLTINEEIESVISKKLHKEINEDQEDKVQEQSNE